MKNPSAQYKRIRRLMQKAITGYHMIEAGDCITVGVSGGADSLVLLHMLSDFKLHIYHDFDICAVHIDLGFKGKNHYLTKLQKFCQDSGIDIKIIQTQISKAALDPDAKKNPCFICSMKRREEIYKFAHRNRCNKIAYGHHQDDIIETLLINILYGRKIESMNPVQPVFSGTLEIIRPLALVPETLVKSAAKEIGVPIIPNLCPVDGKTRRQKIKEILSVLQKTEPNANIKRNIFRSMLHVNIDFPEISKDNILKDKQ
ncbi:tRNA 2-thiocytidine(32) synthetase TtcA [bacterium]|nr:tRNA 2-thiocytidine(32) synthetase TtcA [bacterium]